MSGQTLHDVFREVFENEHFVLDRELTPRRVPKWDSYAHIVLISTLESTFSVVFTTEEITGIKKVGDIVDLLRAKGCTVTL